MSSPGGPGDRSRIAGRLQLADLHARGETPPGEVRVGTEYEKFGVTADGAPLRYHGADAEPGILDVFEHLEPDAVATLEDGGVVIGLKLAGGALLSLEPAGQIEYSGAPHATIAETARDIEQFERRLAEFSWAHGVRWVWRGYTPVHSFGDLDFMPKRRYGVMRRYLPTRGELALHMMQRTATVQANLDYRDEADMGQKLRAAMGLGPVVTAMFANSPLTEGRLNGYKSFRAHIWTKTDPDRCGLLRWVFDDELPTYERYVDYAMGVPLFFIVRRDDYVDCAGLPFEQFLREGFAGHHATVADWELHLSTIFPEVRLKTYIEARGADCVPPDYVLAVPALWKGIFYDGTSLDAGWDLVKRWSWTDRLQHLHAVAVDGLQARTPNGYETAELARELLEIARYGLKQQAERYDHEDEWRYLAPLAALTHEGRAPADLTVAWLRETPGARAREILAHHEADWPLAAEDAAGG